MQIWHRGNWHWYLKQERRYPATLPALSRGWVPQEAPLIKWDEQHGMRLHVLSRDGAYEQLDLLWELCTSSLGTAAVVDGKDLLLTPLRWGGSYPRLRYVSEPGLASDQQLYNHHHNEWPLPNYIIVIITTRNTDRDGPLPLWPFSCIFTAPHELHPEGDCLMSDHWLVRFMVVIRTRQDTILAFA